MLNINFNSSKEVLCVDIGSKNIKMVIGKHQGQNLTVTKAVTIKTPLSSYSDGNIIDLERIKLEISKVLTAENYRVKRGSFTSNSTNIITREIIIPAAEENELDAIVKFEIEQYLPIDLSDFIINYTIIKKLNVDNVDKYKMQVVAYPKHMADRYFQLVRGLNLKPVALDLNSNSICKLFKSLMGVNGENYYIENSIAVIDLGHEQLRIDVINEGLNLFSRIITSGGKDIDKAIMKQFNLSYEDAEMQKVQTVDLELVTGEEEVSSTTLARNIVSNWVKEINRIIQYYKNMAPGNRVDKIYIHGGSSKLKGIERFLTVNLGMPVKKISSMSNVKLEGSALNTEIEAYINSFGTIIRL